MSALLALLLAATGGQAADPDGPPEHAAMGHCTPKGPASVPPPAAATPPDPDCPPEHAAMGHCTPRASAPPAAQATAPRGTDLPPGNAPAPAPPRANYADRIWGAAAMAPSRRDLARMHGGATLSQVMLNLAEWQVRDGRDGYRWDGEGWFGGDINRLTLRSEGAGDIGGRLDHAEAQALYSRAIGPYFNLQAGVRQDFGRSRARTHAVLGFEGLAPYWFDVEGALFLSDRGEAAARVEASFDQRITQRLILQPRVEINLAAQDVPATDTGAGLSDAEFGLRLRYEIAREFAPYVGIGWDRAFGRTARLARDRGRDTGGAAFVLGVRTWF